MEIKPVRSAQAPNYPVKEEVPAGALTARPPQRWAGNAAARIALGTLAAMSLAGCAPEPPLAGVPLPPEMTTEGTAACVSPTPGLTYEPTAGVPEPPQTPVITYMPEGDVLPPSLNIAPLFLHGEGTGAFGCVMIAPPAFLSEEEALSVINAAAADYGLKFTQSDTPSFSNVLQPATKMYSTDEPRPTDVYITLSPDFVDAAHSVSIEYVSTADVSEWNYAEENISAGTYATADAAAQLSEALEDAAPNEYGYNVGVLYDPCADAGSEEPDDMSSRPSEESAALAREQLKAQAKDFFEWLKKQGVI